MEDVEAERRHDPETTQLGVQGSSQPSLKPSSKKAVPPPYRERDRERQRAGTDILGHRSRNRSRKKPYIVPEGRLPRYTHATVPVHATVNEFPNLQGNRHVTARNSLSGRTKPFELIKEAKRIREQNKKTDRVLQRLLQESLQRKREDAKKDEYQLQHLMQEPLQRKREDEKEAGLPRRSLIKGTFAEYVKRILKPQQSRKRAAPSKQSKTSAGLSVLELPQQIKRGDGAYTTSMDQTVDVGDKKGNPITVDTGPPPKEKSYEGASSSSRTEGRKTSPEHGSWRGTSLTTADGYGSAEFEALPSNRPRVASRLAPASFEQLPVANVRSVGLTDSGPDLGISSQFSPLNRVGRRVFKRPHGQISHGASEATDTYEADERDGDPSVRRRVLDPGIGPSDGFKQAVMHDTEKAAAKSIPPAMTLTKNLSDAGRGCKRPDHGNDAVAVLKPSNISTNVDAQSVISSDIPDHDIPDHMRDISPIPNNVFRLARTRKRELEAKSISDENDADLRPPNQKPTPAVPHGMSTAATQLSAESYACQPVAGSNDNRPLPGTIDPTHGLYRQRIFSALGSVLVGEHGQKITLPVRAAREMSWVPTQLFVFSDDVTLSITDYLKGYVEDTMGEVWSWWPLAPRQHQLRDGFCRLSWTLPCGKARHVDLPSNSKAAIQDAFQSAPAFVNDRPSHSKLAGVSTTAGPTHTSSSTLSPGSQNIAAMSSSLPTGHAIPVQPTRTPAPIISTGLQPPINMPQPCQKGLYIYICIEAGSRQFVGLDCTGVQTDIEFFANIKSEYDKARGRLRLWLSTWRYDHCEFFQFQKTGIGLGARLKIAFPDPSDPLYDYDPRPPKELPPDGPISHDEFREHYYYTICPSLLSWERWHRRQISLSTIEKEALAAVPKRNVKLDMQNGKREHFYGLYAREARSAWRVALHLTLCNVPGVVFFFAWLYGMGHGSDLQGAAVPVQLSLSLTLGYLGVLYWTRGG